MEEEEEVDASEDDRVEPPPEYHGLRPRCIVEQYIEPMHLLPIIFIIIHQFHYSRVPARIRPKPISMDAASSSAKATIVAQLQAVKRKSGKTFAHIAEETGLTNVYVAQLLRRQAQLKPTTVPLLRAALPALTDDLLLEMIQPPLRSYDPNLIQEPTIYRLHEAVMHFGESIKEIINEDFGDGIMSAIDFYCSVDKVKGIDGKDRVIVTFDGKYLPYTEQATEQMVSRMKKQEHQDGKPKLS